MTAPSFTPTEQVQTGVRGKRSVVGVLTVPTSGTSGTAVSAGKTGTIRQLHGLKRLEMLDSKTSNGYVPSFTENDLKFHGSKSAAANASEPGEDNYPDLLGGVAASQTGADQASEPVNGHAVLAISDANATTSGNLAHAAGKTVSWTPDYARNVVIVFSEGGAGATFAGGTLTLTGGSDQFGNAIAPVAVTVPAITLAAGKFRWLVVANVFGTGFTNAKLSAAQGAGTFIGIGLGTKLGLSALLATPVAGDVKTVQKGTAKGAYSVDTATNAVLLTADLADGNDVFVTYLATGSTSAGLATVEASASTDLGTCRVRAVGW